MSSQTASNGRRTGALIAIGGNEDRTHHREVLKESLRALPAGAGGPPRVAVFTAASLEPVRQWKAYREAFGALGGQPVWLDVRSRSDAEAAARLDDLRAADLLFMTGGDQERLVGLLNGTAAHRLILQRHRDEGLAIAGTSAGASALGTLMPGGKVIEDGAEIDLNNDPMPPGLGLIPGLVIDQHFTQRRRLARLISLVSRRGGLVGLGIDEDTAAVIRPGPSLTVVGKGAVTLVDCRHAQRSGVDQDIASLRRVSFHRAVSGVTLNARGGGTGFAALLP
jgi:cyanophycinase